METIGTSMASVGKVRDWHQPRNEDCMHNASPAADCTCKRIVQRKPFKTVRATCPEADRAAHRNIVATIRMDNGLLTLRFKGKRKTVSTTLLALYERLTMLEAQRVIRERKAARKARRSKPVIPSSPLNKTRLSTRSCRSWPTPSSK